MEKRKTGKAEVNQNKHSTEFFLLLFSKIHMSTNQNKIVLNHKDLKQHIQSDTNKYILVQLIHWERMLRQTHNKRDHMKILKF